MHDCPAKAIIIDPESNDPEKIGRYTDTGRWYHHPEISSDDIAAQKTGELGEQIFTMGKTDANLRVVGAIKRVIG